ncbi:MAG TPA: alpha/beta hydrolase, partial [Glaciihabitans sp.]|nr:alpha/beta hydrolase [Glaciihabitans sp.]
MKKRSLTAIVAALALVLPLSACSAWFEPPVANSEPTGEEVAAELEPYYSQVLEWTDCGNDMQCTMVEAPLSWADPAGDTINLSLVRQQATSGNAMGSLLVNPGGPGGSGVDLIKDSIDYATSETLQQNFDIVGFDPRGVGESTPVSCYDDPAQ